MNLRQYRAVANQYMLSEAGTGTAQIAVLFDVLEEGVPERQLVWYGFFTDGAFDITIKALRACGWKGTNLAEIDALPNEVILVVEDEEYEGKIRAKVQFINEPGLAVKNPMTPDAAKAFAAALASRVAAYDAAHPPRPVVRGQPARPAQPAGARLPPSAGRQGPPSAREEPPPPSDRDAPPPSRGQRMMHVPADDGIPF